MWLPDSIQISKQLIQAELNGEVPEGTTLATAAFILNLATRETVKSIADQYGFDRSVSKAAWTFLVNGKIATNGEQTSASSGESPKKSESGPTTEDTRLVTLRNFFIEYFPDFPEPTDSQLSAMLEMIHEQNESTEWVEEILYALANGNKTEVKNPITLTLHIMRKGNPQADRQQADIIRRKGVSEDAFVKQVIRKAEATIRELPPLEPTPASSIREKKERIKRGRPIA